MDLLNVDSLSEVISKVLNKDLASCMFPNYKKANAFVSTANEISYIRSKSSIPVDVSDPKLRLLQDLWDYPPFSQRFGS
jgi:hypothetical protein